jgi:hypothetical protein
MDKQQASKNDKNRKVQSPSTKKPLPEPTSDSPMGKFNKAMRKILSVPKKNLKDK